MRTTETPPHGATSTPAPRQLELTPRREVYSVARLNREVRQLVESGLARLWVEGEISNLRRPSSGHLYFTLKDGRAQVRCAMFQSRHAALPFQPRDGAKVQVRARATVYEPRGEFQLVVEHMEDAGEGALQRAFEALKQKLAAEGLFDAAARRPLPGLPRRIGVVTSPDAAALRDVLKVLRRRFPAVPVLIYPTSVQGTAAAPRIVAALRRASRRAECDVLILTRGGGSLEDLWPFNEEAVARAIRACSVPVISAVGHEIDVTIADFAADRRAPTPSAAAELVVPDRYAWLRDLRARQARLNGAARRRLRHGADQVRALGRRLQRQHPGQRLRQQMQRLDELEGRLASAARAALRERRGRVREQWSHLRRVSPAHRLDRLGERNATLAARLDAAMRNALERRRGGLRLAGRALHAVSPLATLERGYAIVTAAGDDRGAARILRDAASAAPGDRITARLARGSVEAEIRTVHPGAEPIEPPHKEDP